MASVSSVNSVSFGGSQRGNENQSHTLRNTSLFAGGGALALGGLEFLNQRYIIKNPEKIIKGMEDGLKENLKKLDSKEGKESFKKLCERSGKKFDEELGRIKTLLTEGFEDAKQYITDFSKKGKYDWKEIGKSAAWGAAIAGGIYLAGHFIYSLFSNKNKK